jgi:hypothetical protein
MSFHSKLEIRISTNIPLLPVVPGTIDDVVSSSPLYNHHHNHNEHMPLDIITVSQLLFPFVVVVVFEEKASDIEKKQPSNQQQEYRTIV